MSWLFYSKKPKLAKQSSLLRWSVVLVGAMSLLTASCPVATYRMAALPPVMLWAWEKPEDLRFLDSRRVGVAFLAQTLRWRDGELEAVPRRQPLMLAEGVQVMAVTRIESDNWRLRTSEDNGKIIVRILKTLDQPKVAAIQVDFDAKVSERAAYRRLLQDLRAALPESVPLSITALASFCLGDPWLLGLPVDETVPMLFRMGQDSRRIKVFLAQGGDFSAPLCRHGYGIAIDEPLPVSFQGRRVYAFNPWPQAWDEAMLERLGELVGAGKKSVD